MWDLIVDASGAAFVAVVGWWHMRRQRQSLFQRWIQKFVEANPKLFERRGA